METRVRRLCFNWGQGIIDLLKNLTQDIPRDAKFERWYIGQEMLGGQLNIVISSNEFEEIPAGSLICDLPITISGIEK